MGDIGEDSGGGIQLDGSGVKNRLRRERETGLLRRIHCVVMAGRYSRRTPCFLESLDLRG